MSCNYQNLNDICLNRYAYQYQNVIFNGNTCVIDNGDSATVIRIDKDTGTVDIINKFSSSIVEDCNLNTENESISSWDCYQLYKQLGGIVNDPSIETFRSEQTKYIISSYNDALTSGIGISINGNSFTLGASLNNQVYYRNIISMAQLLYNDDVDSTMPIFTDLKNISYQFNYDDLSSIFQSYFSTVIYLKTLKDFLLHKIENSDKIIDIQSVVWNTTIPIDKEPEQTSDAVLKSLEKVISVCLDNISYS